MRISRLIGIISLFCWCGSVWSQSRFDYYYMEAEKCRMAEEFSAAAELYGHCLDIRPDAPEAVYNLGIMQLYLQQDSIGIGMLQRASELDSCNPLYVETLASIYLNSRESEKAIPFLERMAKLQSKRSDVLAQLAQLYKNSGKTKEAIEVLDRMELLEGKSTQISLQKFALYLDLDQKDTAFNELKLLCDEFPHDQNCKVLMGNRYAQCGDMEKAKQIYDEVLATEPNNEMLQLSFLDYYEEMNMKEEYNALRDSLLYASETDQVLKIAIMRDYISKAERDANQKEGMLQAFDHLLQMPQKDARILMLKVAYQTYAKESQDSIAVTLRKVLEVEPSNKTALSQLLQHSINQQDMQALEDICRRGVNAYPEEMGYFYFLGLALYQQGKTQEVEEIVCRGLDGCAREENPAMTSDMYQILGDLFHQQNRLDEAFAACDSALVYNENNISCMNNYAYYLSLRGENLDKAEELSYKTIKAEPTNKTYLDTFAWILFTKGEYTEARHYIDRVVDPEVPDEALLADSALNAGLLEHAGDIYFHCGDSARAVHLWRLALSFDDGTGSALLPKKAKKKKYLK